MISTTQGKFALTNVRLSIPNTGNWVMDLEAIVVDPDVTLSGKCNVEVAGRTWTGTIVSGGQSGGKSLYRIVGGNGHLAAPVDPAGYEYVLLREPLSRAVAQAGEVLDPASNRAILDTVLPKCVVRRGPLGETLTQLLDLSPSARWRVTHEGKVRVYSTGDKSPVFVASREHPLTLLEDDQRSSTQRFGSSELSMLPGQVVEGKKILHVDLHLENGVGRAEVLVERPGEPSTVSEILSPLAEIIMAVIRPKIRYLGSYEAEILEQTGDTLSVKFVDEDLPELTNVPVFGPPGFQVQVNPGCICHVQFSDADLRKPFVANFQADGAVLKSLKVNASGDIRLGTNATGSITRKGDGMLGSIPPMYVKTPTGPLAVEAYPKIPLPALPEPPGIPMALVVLSGSDNVRVT